MRRRVQSNVSLSDLQALAGGAETLTYTDDEGDVITIATEQDVAEALAFATTSKRFLRLKAEEASIYGDQSQPRARDGCDAPTGALNQDASLARGQRSWYACNPNLWSFTRQAGINLAFATIFGAFFVRMVLGIVMSTFGIFMSFFFIVFKIVPLAGLIFLWLKISGKSSVCRRRGNVRINAQAAEAFLAQIQEVGRGK